MFLVVTSGLSSMIKNGSLALLLSLRFIVTMSFTEFTALSSVIPCQNHPTATFPELQDTFLMSLPGCFYDKERFVGSDILSLLYFVTRLFWTVCGNLLFRVNYRASDLLRVSLHLFQIVPRHSNRAISRATRHVSAVGSRLFL